MLLWDVKNNFKEKVMTTLQEDIQALLIQLVNLNEMLSAKLCSVNYYLEDTPDNSENNHKELLVFAEKLNETCQELEDLIKKLPIKHFGDFWGYTPNY